MQKAKCRTCNAPIIWVYMAASGRLMPLDDKPADDGTVWIVDGKGVTAGNVSMFEDMLQGPKYKSHFATCPQAQEHRKAKK